MMNSDSDQMQQFLDQIEEWKPVQISSDSIHLSQKLSQRDLMESSSSLLPSDDEQGQSEYEQVLQDQENRLILIENQQNENVKSRVKKEGKFMEQHSKDDNKDTASHIEKSQPNLSS